MADYVGAVKNGKFYHVYGRGTSAERWVYVRPASTANGGTSAGPAPGQAQTTALPAPVAAPPPPPPAPFLTADDLMSQNNFWTQWNQQFSDLDAALAKLRTDTNYNQAQADDAYRNNKASIADNAAARGLTRSSVKDGQVAQQQTDYNRLTQHNKDTVQNMANDVAGRKNYFNTTALPQFQAAMNRKAAENALAASYNAPPPAAPAAAPAAPRPTQASGGYRNIVKNGKFYHVYGYGTSREQWRYIRPAS